jgi:hypothetical protein
MKRTLIIIFSLLALLLILMSVFFEVKEVPVIKSESSYTIQKSDQDGLWMFDAMLKERYGEDQVEIEKRDSLNYLKDYEDYLLIFIGNNFYFDETETYQLQEFTSSGNEVLFITNSFSTIGQDISPNPIYYSTQDSLFSLTWVDDCIDYPYSGRTASDSPHTSTRLKYIAHDTLYDSCDYIPLVKAGESYPVFSKVECDTNTYYLHSIPQLFTNGGALKTDYRVNFNETFDVFDNSKVIIHLPLKANNYIGNNKESLLQYILSQPPLKYAYYLTLLLALIFVIFASKRKQKEIPIIKPKENTTHEYIETISALYMAQDQNERLVAHMKSNFYHKIKVAYFLDASAPDFAEKLAKKSKYPIEKIQSIVKQLNIVDHYSFNDDQLIRLYKDIYSFDKNRK